jgi:hypothetical protein
VPKTFAFTHPLPLKRERKTENMMRLILPIMQLHFPTTSLLDSDLPLFCLVASIVTISKEKKCNVQIQHCEQRGYMIAVSDKEVQ